MLGRAAQAIGLLGASIVAGIASAHMMMSAEAQRLDAQGMAWRRFPTAADNPYVLARYLARGVLPPAHAAEFEADGDIEGRALHGDCTYLVTMSAPRVRWWSLRVTPLAEPDRRGAMGADLAIAEADGSLKLAVSHEPQPGNWLDPGRTDRFTLILGLHPGTAPARFAPALGDLPRIERVRCR